MVRRHGHEATILDWPERTLADIDRPEDYQRILAELRAGAAESESKSKSKREKG
jgi:hypothetical protein